MGGGGGGPWCLDEVDYCGSSEIFLFTIYNNMELLQSEQLSLCKYPIPCDITFRRASTYLKLAVCNVVPLGRGNM